MIVRDGKIATGGITKKEKKQMEAISKKWIDIAFKTGRTDRKKLTSAIEKLYEIAGLKKPNVVIVNSPLIMSLAYGISSVVWYLRNNNSLRDATRDVTANVTRIATDTDTRNASLDATDEVTREAIDTDTRNAAIDATLEATFNATFDALRDATDEATYNATGSATDTATREATFNATFNATANATRDAIDNATRNATRIATDTDTAIDEATATRNATREATDTDTRDATFNVTATRDATFNITANATRDATDEAIFEATDTTTRETTFNVTYNATANAIDDATFEATFSATANDKTKNMYKSISEKFINNKYFDMVKKNAHLWSRVYQGGNMWVSFPSYYEACRDVLGLKELTCWDNYSPWEECAKLGGFRVMHENFCIVCDFPEILKTIKQGNRYILHNESGPAIRWRDGFEFYYLNGVKVTKEIVMTPAEKLDPRIILTENNAEVRREIIRKIGAEFICKKLEAKTIATGIDYNGSSCELLKLFINQSELTAIKLKNPSVEGVYHIEWVDNNCKTIDDALTFRKPEKLKKIPVDEINGADWYEQGDVVVWPKNAKSIKSKPIILT